MTIHLLCGVPGSGKSSIARSLSDAFDYVPHDEIRDRRLYAGALLDADRTSGGRPVLGEAPFGIQALVDQLKAGGASVVTHYLSEPTAVVAKRYVGRTGKPWRQQHADNKARYDVRDWDNRGTPDEIHAKLQDIGSLLTALKR
jgi:predicted kinase